MADVYPRQGEKRSFRQKSSGPGRHLIFAVYREAFEVVLSYQALWLQNESSRERLFGAL